VDCYWADGWGKVSRVIENCEMMNGGRLRETWKFLALRTGYLRLPTIKESEPKLRN